MSTSAPTYRLDRRPPPALPVPRLDASQLAVVDHAGGPLLVLAGPGTGKTTTLVEAVVERVRRGLRPEQVLVLTFSRKAADELRERITTRLGRTISSPSAWTFHGWCLALVSAYDGRGATPRLLSGPERLVRIRELLAGHLAGEGSTRWPGPLRGAVRTRGFAAELADLLDRARERGMEAADLRALAATEDRDDWRAAADFFEEYVAVLGDREIDYGELVRRALLLLDDLVVLREVRGRYGCVFVDEYQDTDPAQEELLAALA
ncbi:MAG: UvrD-helicase domain-containing protein, partial [Mycobacteriales bacterium]